jgi:hypothetical protein
MTKLIEQKNRGFDEHDLQKKIFAYNDFSNLRRHFVRRIIFDNFICYRNLLLLLIFSYLKIVDHFQESTCEI